MTTDHRNGRDVVEMTDGGFCQLSLPINWHSTHSSCLPPQRAAFPQTGFQGKPAAQLCNSFIPTEMSFTANVSTVGDISPSELIFMMRDYPLYKSYEKYVTTSGGFGVGAVHHLQLE